MIVLSCSPSHKCNSNNNSMNGQRYELQARSFTEIPKDLLGNIDRMGIDECLLLTELEGRYFNALYQINELEFNFSGKKMAFFTGSLGKSKSNKKRYFMAERGRLNTNYSPMLYTFSIPHAGQKAESGGYDAAIVYWSKTLVSIKDVVKRLKEQKK